MCVHISQDNYSVPTLCSLDTQAGGRNGMLDSPLCRDYILTKVRNGEGAIVDSKYISRVNCPVPAVNLLTGLV